MRNLRTIRNLNHLSQSDVARTAGFHQTYISAIERGLSVVDVSHVSRIAAALGVDEQALVSDVIEVNADGTVRAVVKAT